MLDGWYCRSIANANTPDEDDEPEDDSLKAKAQYKNLKKKLKYLIYVIFSFRIIKAEYLPN